MFYIGVGVSVHNHEIHILGKIDTLTQNCLASFLISHNILFKHDTLYFSLPFVNNLIFSLTFLSHYTSHHHPWKIWC
jgi:hypothetical protein